MDLLETRPNEDGQFTILSIGFDLTPTHSRHRALQRADYAIVEANDVLAVFSHLASLQLDLLLIGRAVPQLDREWLITAVRHQYPDLPILFVAPRIRGKRMIASGCFCVSDPSDDFKQPRHSIHNRRSAKRLPPEIWRRQ
jgi:hypothetical protein